MVVYDALVYALNSYKLLILKFVNSLTNNTDIRQILSDGYLTDTDTFF